MKARLDCERIECINYGGLGCWGTGGDPLNQTCCRLELNDATKCLNDSNYPMYITMDEMSVDDYMKHLKEKWPLDEKAQKPVKV